MIPGLAVALAALASSGALVEVEIRVAGGARLKDPTAWAIAIPNDAAALKALPRGAAEPAPHGACTLRLQPGYWTIGATSEGAWVTPVDLRIASNHRKAKLSLTAWTAGRLKARLRYDAGAMRGATIAVTLKSVASDATAGGVPATTVSCPVDSDRVSCDLPAVPLDIQLREGGYVPRYYWNLRPSPAGEFELGDVMMQSGSSVVGWVHSTGRPVSRARVEVREAAPPPPELGDQAETAQVTTSNTNGFFQFGPLAAGSYVISANHEGEVGLDVPIALGTGAEYVIREPIKLKATQRLSVTLTPPSTPEGAPWRIKLLSLSGVAPPLVWGAAVASDGTWTRETVPSGSYRLFVVDQSGARWATRVLELGDQGDSKIVIDLGLTNVRGRVRLGDKPLGNAAVRVGDADGFVELRASSDEEGEFSFVVPGELVAEAARWSVAIASEVPVVRRTLRDYAPERGVDGSIYMDIKLSGGSLRATLLDSDGRRWTKDAVVTIQGISNSLDRFDARLAPADTAELEFRGLVQGDYLVEAKGTGGFVSDQILRAVGPSQPAEVELVLRGRVNVDGVVRGFDGTPLAGVRVRGVPAEAVVGGGREFITGSDGTFSLSVPRASTAVLLSVAARGFGYTIGRFPVGDEPIAITLDRSSGSLILEHESDLEGEDGTYVRVNGGFENARTLLDWSGASTHQDDGTRTTVIDGLAPGHYSVCRFTLGGVGAFLAGSMERCAAGVVRPGSTVRVKVPEARRGQK